MKIALFAMFSQFLDMITTWWGHNHGMFERNSRLPDSINGIIGVKLGLITIVVILYLLFQYVKLPRFFNLLVGIPSILVFSIGMTNLSVEFK